MRSLPLPVGRFALSLAALVSALPLACGVARAQVFIVSSDSNSIYRTSLNGGTATTLLQTNDLSSPSAITVGVGGDLFVSSFGGGRIIRVNPATGAYSNFGAGINRPYFSVYRASTSDLFVTSFAGNTIQKLNSLGQVSTFATGIGSPRGLALAPNGNLFVSLFSDTIGLVDGNTGAVSSFVTIPGASIMSLAFDGAGNLYASDHNTNSIRRITTGTTPSVTTFATG